MLANLAAEDEVGGDPTNIQDVESAIHEIPGNFCMYRVLYDWKKRSKH